MFSLFTTIICFFTTLIYRKVFEDVFPLFPGGCCVAGPYVDKVKNEINDRDLYFD